MGSHVSGISAFFPALAEPQSLRRDEQAGEAAFQQSLCGEGTAEVSDGTLARLSRRPCPRPHARPAS